MNERHPRLIIRGGHVLSMDNYVGDLPKGDVLIENGRIVAVNETIEAGDAQVVDAGGMIVLPGFVDTHRHTWQTQLRGVASDWTLFNYTTQIRLGYSGCYDPQDAYVGNYAGAIEALNAGVTTIVDHSHIMNSPEHADEALRGLVDSGIRAVFCYGLFPNPKHNPFRFDDFDASWRYEDVRRVRRDKLSSDAGPVYFGISPAEVEKSPFETTCAEIRLGRELGARMISCHVAMSGYSSAFGKPIVARLGQERLLGPDVILVHGNSLTRHELGLIADFGSGISATPEIEMQMGMGRPITGRALAAGAKISLGVDIVSNIPGDMFGPMRVTLMEERAARNDTLVAQDQVPRRLDFTCRDVVELATIKGARAANLDSEIGSLTIGKRADVICVRRDSLNLMGVLDPYSALVHYANGHDVDTVVIDGRVLKHAGRLTGRPSSEVAAMAAASRDRIEERMQPVLRTELEDYYKGRYNFGN